MNRPGLQIAAICSISCWPALNFMMANWGEIMQRGGDSTFGVLSITLVFVAVGLLSYRWSSHSGLGGFVVVGWLVLIVLLFGYAAMRNATTSAFEKLGLSIPPDAVWLLALALIVALVTRYRRAEKLHFAATTFSLVAVSVTTFMLVGTVLRFEAPPRAEAAPQRSIVAMPARTSRLNVYYIILDAYAGARALRQSFAFDNSAFITHMAARGFVDVTTEQSNYLKTSQTLGAIFALDYAQTEEPDTWQDSRLYPDVFRDAQPPALIVRLNAAGYSVRHAASVWSGCSHQHVECLQDASLLGTNYTTQAFLAATPVGRWLFSVLGARNNALASVAANLPTLLASGHPYFVFTHHLSPHPPFIQDRRCERHVPKHNNPMNWQADSRPEYLEAVQCVNLQLEWLVDEIIQANPEALIVLQGDHGSAFGLRWNTPMADWPAASLRERMSYLNLIRAPASCARWLDRKLGQVNTARFVLGCVEGRAPDYLPEKTYVSTYLGAEVGEVRRWPGGGAGKLVLPDRDSRN